MADSMARLLVGLLGSYLIGSIPTAYLMVKWLKRIDVRTVGSGNVGATNVSRIAGVHAAVAVFLLDATKGLIAVWALAPWTAASRILTAQLLCGLAAIFGHNFPILLGFRGGKGLSTTIGVLVGAMPMVAATCLAVLAGCVLIWRYMSVGALAAAVTLPVAQWLAGQAGTDILLGSVMALLMITRHRANIVRLRQGTEHKLGRRL